MDKFCINKFSGLVIGATMVTCITCYNSYKPNAYEVYVNGRSVAYVDNKEKVEKVNKQIINELSKRFSNVSLNNNITYDRVIAVRDALNDEASIREKILKSDNAVVNATELYIDGKCIGVLANEKEGDEVFQKVAKHYLSKINFENIKVNVIKNKINYTPKAVKISTVNSVEDIYSYIISQNEKNKVPCISMEFTGKSNEKLSANFSTVINWSDTLLKGQSRVKEPGECGTKIVEKQITLINGKVSETRIIKETIIQKPKDRVVIKGTKVEEVCISSMAIPSRGSVSSVFGIRWGRMHEGIDIAAEIGTPIYAALEGKVVFSGTEGGYGKMIKISHKDSVETIYGHCSNLRVKVNQIVKKGDLIGNTGNTGNSTGPHLHFEVRIKGVPQNPAPYIYTSS